MNTVVPPRSSLYSRTFPLLLMGIDAGLWVLVYLGGAYLKPYAFFPEFPIYLLFIGMLVWWSITLLSDHYQPDSVRFPQFLNVTGCTAIGHLSCTFVLCLVGQWFVFTLAIVCLNVSFYVIRVLALWLLNKVYGYIKQRTDNLTRFIIVGEAAISHPLRDYLLRNNAEFMGYVDVTVLPLATGNHNYLHQLCLKHRVTHIYCTLPAQRWSNYTRELQQFADDSFIYFHWTSAHSLEGHWKQLVDGQIVPSLLIYNPQNNR